MSSKVYKDKHNNIIKFNPYEKKEDMKSMAKL